MVLRFLLPNTFIPFPHLISPGESPLYSGLCFFFFFCFFSGKAPFLHSESTFFTWEARFGSPYFLGGHSALGVG